METYRAQPVDRLLERIEGQKSKTCVVGGHSRELMVFDKQKLYEVGGTRQDGIRKWAAEHEGPSSRSGLAGDDIAKSG